MTLGVFLGVCAVARLSSFPEPQPITGALILLATFALAVELAWAWKTHRNATSIADELILHGYSGDRQRTPVARALSSRISSIESQRARHRLAQDIRWRLRLATGTARPSPGYIRACAFPPLGTAGRRVFLEEQFHLIEMADRIERPNVDPRAIVILRRALTTPIAPVGVRVGKAMSEERSAEQLRETLRHAYVLLQGSEEPDPARRHRGPVGLVSKTSAARDPMHRSPRVRGRPMRARVEGMGHCAQAPPAPTTGAEVSVRSTFEPALGQEPGRVTYGWSSLIARCGDDVVAVGHRHCTPAYPAKPGSGTPLRPGRTANTLPDSG